MPTPDELESVLAEVGSASQRIRDALRAATADQLAADSPLPDWTRAHVAAHVAGLSHAMARQFEYASRGEQIEYYTGGMEGRNAEIEVLAARSAEQLKVEVAQALDHFAEAMGSMTPADWTRPISYREGDAFSGLEAAWREYVIHLVDLDLGATNSEWTEAFCLNAIGFLASRVPQGMTLVVPSGLRLGDGAEEVQADGTLQDLAAWLAGREPVGPISFSIGHTPELGPWPARKN
ncbi:MAG: maleylpyruvate isomerase family mycothiol-dependent enzyme [Aeromicrobium sp.]